MKTFKQVTEAYSTRIKRGFQVSRKANPRHIGLVQQTIHNNQGSFAHVKWNNGWKERMIPFHELDHHIDDTNQYERNRIGDKMRGTVPIDDKRRR